MPIITPLGAGQSAQKDEPALESDLPFDPSDSAEAQNNPYSEERKKLFLYPFLLGRENTWTRSLSSLLDNTCQPFKRTDGAATPVG